MTMNRREFSKMLGMAGVLAPAAWGGAAATPDSAQASPAAHPQSSTAAAGEFPAGSYTPYGYLDNPYHTWDLHPSGVVRSVPPVGMGWYFPAGPGGYFSYKKNSVYRAILRVGLRIGDTVLFEEDDFRAAGVKINSSYHSKNILRLDFAVANVSISASFFLVGENTLACHLSLQNGGGAAKDVYVFALERLELGESSWWGRDGISGAFEEHDQHCLLRSFAAGPVFVLKVDHPAETHLVATDAALQDWMAGKGTPTPAATTYFPDPLNAALGFRASVAPGAKWAGKLLLCRAENERFARRETRASAPRTEAVHAEKVAEDARFWAQAPRLEGDFPEHWKNSWVYDFETLRMMVRRPVGVYKHPWDAMQIQAPRNVLAETSIDMWTLGYADPDIAKTVLLGQFQDALEANVPCMREDGTMNMVSADGSECGTSVAWCYPFYCMESIFLRTGDQAWLGKLYPYIAAFLEWTLKHRTDSEGWVVAKCSWESGMDGSSRFLIQQPTGGELIDFIRVAGVPGGDGPRGALHGRLRQAPRPSRRHRPLAAARRALHGKNPSALLPVMVLRCGRPLRKTHRHPGPPGGDADGSHHVRRRHPRADSRHYARHAGVHSPAGLLAGVGLSGSALRGIHVESGPATAFGYGSL